MILGIDTSNYMTSLCLIRENGEILFDGRRLLQVPEGEKGLQQSTALFGHIRSLPLLFSEIKGYASSINAIGYSGKPRPINGSYMPVFEAGASFANSMASLLGIESFATTHQEGHLAAGEATVQSAVEMAETDALAVRSAFSACQEFLAIHLSGGTTDLLHVRRSSAGYSIEEIGTGLDLHAGQFVDRVGVALGMSFPAGPALEKLAAEWNGAAEDGDELTFPSPVRGLSISFSGPLTAALKAIESGFPPSQIARSVESCIAKGLEKVLLNARDQTGLRSVLIVGGVASNLYIRKRLSKRLEHRAVGMKLFFAKPRFSSDNAYGVACLTRNYFQKNKQQD